MKKITAFVLMLLLFTFYSNAQWVSIPDTNFGKWLNSNTVACMQGNSTAGWQMDTTCSGVTGKIEIACYNKPISDLTGIQYFDNLQTLLCYNCQLSNLSTLPPRLGILECDNNLLSSLPPLPASLKQLDCYDNPLGNLPTLNDSLVVLGCSNNQLSVLPALPSSLKALYCNNNQLSNLPVLPVFLDQLNCHHNQLSTLPELPDTLSYCYINDNPLNCLPKFRFIYNLNFTNTNITCLPNYGTVINSTPALNSLPLCDSSNNVNGCLVLTSCAAHYTLYPDSTIAQNWFALNQATGIGPLSYLWQWGDSSTSTGATPSHTYSAAGNYNICLTISDSIGCSATYCDSSTYIYKTESMVTVNAVWQLPVQTEIAELSNSSIRLYPNPATNQLFIQTNGTAVSEVNIYNTTGSLVSQTKQPQTKSIDISNLPNSVYIAEVKTKEASVMRRWVKM